MYGEHYAWIIFGAISPRQIFGDDKRLKGFINCTADQLRQAADRYIATIKLDIRQDNKTTISGLVSNLLVQNKTSLSQNIYNMLTL